MEYSVNDIADVFAGRPRNQEVIDLVKQRLLTFKGRKEMPSLVEAMAVVCGLDQETVAKAITVDHWAGVK